MAVCQLGDSIGIVLLHYKITENIDYDGFGLQVKGKELMLPLISYIGINDL